jgi:DUF4097 and DUF4098 domain-containing protein YvlB
MIKKIRKSLAILVCLMLIVATALIFNGCSANCLEKFQIKNYDITENFNSLFIETETADLSLAPSEDGTCKVVCYEKNDLTYLAKVTDNVLSVKVNDTRKWFTNINLFFGKPKVIVYLPKFEYSSLVIKEDTGDIEIPRDFKFENVELSLSTGDVVVDGLTTNTLDVALSTGDVTITNANVSSDVKVTVSTGKTTFTNLNCKNLTSNGSTGKAILTNVIASGKIDVKRSTGDVIFDNSDANEILVETDTGDVKGSLRSAKIFVTRTDTGRIDVPDSTSGGKCKITTDTGNINITIN